MHQKRWDLAPDRPQLRAALEAAGYPTLLATVLCARGVESLDAARLLLLPRGEPLHDPLLLRDMDRAVRRIGEALRRGETVAVYGDYDVDGITATALLVDYLRTLGAQVKGYIPDRIEEGYGLNRDAVQELAQQGISLIVTVDCGITAVDEVALAAQLGVDVVITDHHACKAELPNACAVVNPHRPDCAYPFPGLAGVGVALKLAMALAGPTDAQEVFQRYADLAAIGTVADVMSMTGENRGIVSRGLELINRAPRLGLTMLAQEAGLGNKPISAVSIGYTLAPRINASGRMGRSALAAELLLAQQPQRAEELAQELCSLNRSRQVIEGDIFTQCVAQLDRETQRGLILLAEEGWHQGVVGIVASRLAERYGCPAFMVCLSGGMGKGSCRSWGGVNLFSLLTDAKDLLEGFGGHAMAAGFTIKAENLPLFDRRLRERLPGAAPGEDSCNRLSLDGCVRADDLTVTAVQSLERLEPCGADNPRPTLMLQGATVQFVGQVGRGRHLKLRLESRGTLLDAIWFSAGHEAQALSAGDRVDVAFYPQINEFRGCCSVQLQIVDLRPALTRAQQERTAYEKYRRGEALTPREAQLLLPAREEFVQVWKYLKGRSALNPVIEETPAHIARGTGRAEGRRETMPRTMVCLEVLEERGLICLGSRQDRVCITLNVVEEKVDLEGSSILRRLRRFVQ